MWLKCTLCEHKVFGTERDWGKICPTGNCEGTLAFDTGIQKLYAVRRPDLSGLSLRNFRCEKCKKIVPERQLDRFEPYKCPNAACDGNLEPI